MRAKKHLWEAALEAMRQEMRARVDEVEVVQEHYLQLMSRVAEPGTSAPITIWARLQAPKRILTLEAEARFLHEALRTRQLLHCIGDWSKKKEIDVCARISPSLKARADAFIATPSPLGGICTLDWSPVELVHRVRQALSADRCFESIVVKALEHTWVKRHQAVDFHERPRIFEALARTACVDACACMCGPPGKLLQRFANKVDSLVKTFARQASKKARVQLGCGEMVYRWLASREAMHTWTWMLLLAVSCWRLPLSSLFAGCILQAIPSHLGSQASLKWMLKRNWRKSLSTCLATEI